KGEDAPFIQSVKPKCINFQICESKVADCVNVVQEDCTLVEQTKKPSCLTHVQVDAVINQDVPLVQGTPQVLGNVGSSYKGLLEPKIINTVDLLCKQLIDVRPEMKRMFDQLKSKVIDTLTTFESACKHAEVVEAEFVNCEINLVECPLVEKDVGVLRVVVDSCDMNLMDCPVVLQRHCKINREKVTVSTCMKSFLRNGFRPKQLYKFTWVNYDIVVDEHFRLALLGLNENKTGWMLDDVEPKHFTFTDIQPSTMEHLVNACAFVSPPLAFYDNLKADKCVEPAQVYFPLNNPKTHWALVELELRTGVITVYDSMTPRKRNKKFPIQKTIEWWIKMKETMTQQLPRKSRFKLLYMETVAYSKRVYLGKDIQNDFRLDWKIDISYKRAWSRKNVALEMLNGSQENSFVQLPLYCHNLQLANDGTVTHIQTIDDRTFDKCFIGFDSKFLILYAAFDEAHLKGTYLVTNLLAVGMDANNQIIPLATGVAQGETVESWSWFLTKLKECIDDVPNLAIISDRHYSITIACRTVFPQAFHRFCCRHLLLNCNLKSKKHKAMYWNTFKAYLERDFEIAISNIRGLRPDAYRKLEEAGFDRWLRAYFPDEPTMDELSRWTAAKDHRALHVVNLTKGECSCHKWKLSGLPCGHVCAVSRVLNMGNNNR
nr:transposase, MuDR, MULE transposase domain protein [Tanacetum cinerariifolium]